MPTFSLSGSDTVTINGRTLADFADGDIADLTTPNELVKVKTGKNGNSIFAKDESGRQVDIKLRVIRGSYDDKFLNNIVQTYLQNSASFILINGQFVKRVGDGSGNISYDTYILGGGVPTRNVPSQQNTDGNTEQSVAVYEFKFTIMVRAIQ